MHARIRSFYIPRSGSEWGEYAGSALAVERLGRDGFWQHVESVNLENMGGCNVFVKD